MRHTNVGLIDAVVGVATL